MARSAVVTTCRSYCNGILLSYAKSLSKLNKLPCLTHQTFTINHLDKMQTNGSVPDDASTAPGNTSTGASFPDDGPGEGKFLYFAFGSNLLARRLLVMNPTAQRFGIGQLKDFRLDFSTPRSQRWDGAPATVVPDPGEFVWGAVWALDITDLKHLDKQEGVETGWYDGFNATVLTPSGGRLQCRCYMMHVVPPKLSPGEARPVERQPSLIYKTVMLTGAHESGLPQEYIAAIEALPHNGSLGVDPPVTMESLQTSPTSSTTSTKGADQTVPAAPAAR